MKKLAYILLISVCCKIH